NSNFDTWFSTVIERPLSWFNVRYLGLNAAQPDSNHMVHKVFFNAPDDFAAEISNIYWGTPGPVFGGELSTKSGVTDDQAGGFPIRGRHVTFNGYYKFFPFGGDTLQISLDLKKAGSVVATAYTLVYDPVTDFTPFSIPISYTDSVNIPDSASIGFRLHNVSGLNSASKFVVDKLSFDGFVSGIKNIKNDLLELDGMKVYPNPARDHLMIENLFADNKACTLSLFSVKGEMIREIKLAAGERLAQIQVGDLSPGFYVLVMKKGDRSFSHKIIIQD
ncbi:MAG: C-terminal target protein, partial [Bacteroidota bacterium]|nr:C-terminal target protein [Bacteroidota bacterium]